MNLIINSGSLVVLFLALNLKASIVNVETFPPILTDGEHSISYSSSAQINFVDWYTGQPFSIQKFNPFLGELKSIDINMAFEFSGSVSVGLFPIEETITINEGDVIAVIGPSLNVGEILLGYLKQTVPISGELNEGELITFNDFTWSDNFIVTFTTSNGSDVLNGYTGTGNIPLGVSASFRAPTKNPPVFVTYNGLLNLDLTIKYHYDIPEPASLLFLAVGGIALLRRKRDIKRL